MGKRKNVIISNDDTEEVTKKSKKQAKMKVEEPVLLEEGDSEVELPAGEPELELLAGESELELTSGQAEAPVVKAVSKVSSNLRKKAGKKIYPRQILD